MTRILATAALVALLAAQPAANAGGATGPEGPRCGLTVLSSDPGYTEIYAGPLLGDGTVVCTIQVGPDERHGDPDQVSVSAASVGGVAILPSTVVPYGPPPDSEVFMCTEWRPANGPALYWQSATNPDDIFGPKREAKWSTDPATPCHTVFAPDPWLDPWLTVDLIVCAVTIPLLPPDGDVDGIWDCPPYES